jgi:hypothetical protein
MRLAALTEAALDLLFWSAAVQTAFSSTGSSGWWCGSIKPGCCCCICGCWSTGSAKAVRLKGVNVLAPDDERVESL